MPDKNALQLTVGLFVRLKARPQLNAVFDVPSRV
jgi:hypothetical protein